MIGSFLFGSRNLIAPELLLRNDLLNRFEFDVLFAYVLVFFFYELIHAGKPRDLDLFVK